MIDTWFKNDLQKIYDEYNIAVFINESGDAEFLLKTVEDEYTIHQTNSELDELYVKYLIEKAARPVNKKYLIYTRTMKKELKFIREYCETCGCLEIRYLQNYIKEKIHQSLNLNINLPKETLIAAAKISVGKDRSYWMNLCIKNTPEIFDLSKELLPFIHDPEAWSKENYDTQVCEIFYREVNKLLGRDYLKKPAATLASEVVKTMFDGLAENNCNQTLESIYKIWLDSVSYHDSFNRYLKKYNISTELDFWNVNIHHPFRKIDEKWFTEIGKIIAQRDDIPNTLKDKLCQRHHSKQAQTLNILFWGDVIALINFDPQNITFLSSFNECIEFYKKHFYKLDTAIRNLYTEFLNKKNLLEPFQELYKEHVLVFLDKWFSYFENYKENQTGTLQKIINESREFKTAVIVGDAVSWEIAEQLSGRLDNSIKLEKGSILADIPSETENNMSRIYMDNGITESIHSNREKYLVAQNPDINIDFARLDEVNEDARPGQFLICTYKDVDEIAEKLQQKALKYFPETIDFFAEKILMLLSSGYKRIYLVADHGFVLTGILSESDKISVMLNGNYYKAERYIRTESRQEELVPALIEVEKKYNQYNYLYFAKNINPFKTPGLYGFSHGGVSPQELITPYFLWENPEAVTNPLSVVIKNKKELNNVTGELFSIKIQAGNESGDLFSAQRKIYLVFFANKKQINKSDVFIIQCDEQLDKEYTFDGYPEIDVHLLDAVTKQQLDKVFVKKNTDRDMGGLL